MKVLLVLSVLTWTLVQNTAGNLLEIGGGGYGGGGFGGYYPPYQPQVPPIQPIAPIVPERQPNLCEIGAAAQLPGACNCQGYSIQICPFVPPGDEPGDEPGEPEHRIAEIIDVKLVDEVTGEILGEEVEEIDVTGQFYPYNQFGRNPFTGSQFGGGYFPPQVPGFRPQPQGQIIGGYGIPPPYMPGASRSLDG